MKKKGYKFQNPFVQHLVKKKQGVHGKTYKQQRGQKKVELKQQLSE